MMRDDEQLLPQQLTPTASISIPQLNEVDRSLVFVVPGADLRFRLSRINSDESSWTDQGEHRQVVQPDVAVYDR